MPVIVAAHDISGVGRCSLTTSLAVLPAMGHTCYPLPTAVLSHQTGIPGYSFLSLTDHMPDYINGWKRLNFTPDMIYTGFLGCGRQPEILSGFIKEHSGALVVVDPVMGDNGALYECFGAQYVQSMRKLVKTAHILVPNLTEFNLLCGFPLWEKPVENHSGLLSLAMEIDAPRLRYIVVTSAVSGGKHCNLLIDVKNKAVAEIPCRNSGVSYNGTGDLFASVLCGEIANGADIKTAVLRAGDFVADCIEAMPPDADARLGIGYERNLVKLCKGV